MSRFTKHNFKISAALIGIFSAVLLALSGQLYFQTFAANVITTLSPSADTYTSSVAPVKDHSTDTALRTNSDPIRRSLLKFAVPQVHLTTRAILKVYAQHDVPAGYSVYVITSAWDPHTVKYEDQPNLGWKIGDSGPVTANSYNSVDVTSVIQGNTNISFELVANDNTEGTYNSQEASSNRPLLVVTTDSTKPPGNPPPPVTGDNQAPTMPGSFTATVIGATVKLTWTPSTDNVGVQGYAIGRADGTNNQLIAGENAQTTTYTDVNPPSGVNLTYKIAAYDAAKNISPIATANTVNIGAVLSSPTNVVAQALSANSVKVTWTGPSNGNVSHYNVFRNNIGIASVPVNAAAPTFTDTSVSPNTKYSYTIVAVDNNSRESAPSAPGSVTTPGSTQVDTTPPSVPGNLTATAASGTQVNLKWNASTDNVGVAGYTVFRGTNQIAKVNASSLSYGDATVSAGTTYSYTVKAFDAANNTSGASNAASVTTPPNQPPPVSGGPCGLTPTAPAHYKHVIWIWMENRNYSAVIGNSAAPYETSLAKGCATNPLWPDAGSQYNSLSNYIAGTAGVDSCNSGCAASTWNDCMPPSSSCQAPVDNIFRQVRAIGGRAISYEESMPGNCSLGNGGGYEAKHNPGVYFTGGTDRQACLSDNVPMGTTGGGNFLSALANDSSLPMFSFITPNMCNDMHDCSTQTGDNWLKGWVPLILNSAAYKSGDTALFIHQDEDTPVPNIEIAPSVKPGTVVSNSSMGHYSALRTTEEMLGINNFLGKAGSAPSMRGPLNF